MYDEAMTVRGLGIRAALGMAVLLAAASARATMPPRQGPLPVEVEAAMRGGVLALPAHPLPERTGTAGAQGLVSTRTLWRIPVVLVSYSDSALITNAGNFNQLLFDTTGVTPTGSVYDYYQWASGGRLRIVPVVVATVTVSHTRAYYGANSHGLNRTSTPRNEAGLLQDAIQLCALNVDWTSFDLDRDGYVDMLWVVHAGPGGEGTQDVNDLWSTTSQLSLYWSNTSPLDVTVPGGPHMLIDRFSVLPELSLFVPRHISEIGVYCHEFGHALGLPDLYDTLHDPLDPTGFNRGPGNWSLMSTGAYGGNGITPQYPVHPGAWCSIYLGWAQSFRPAQDTVVTLMSVPDGGSVMELAFQGELDPEHFLAECRKREAFDRLLPAEGLVLYHVNELWIGESIQSNLVNAGPNPALVLVEADGRGDLLHGYNQGDSTDAFPGALGRTWVVDDVVQPSTATFRLVPTSMGLLDIGLQGGGVRVKAQVRAPGWEPPVDQGDPGFAPSGGFGIAPSAVVDAAGNISSVASESRAGHTQIVLRSRVGGAWQAPIQISHSTGNALDPTIALLPGGDLAVAWSDTRAVRSHIFYCARVRGQWIAEQAIENLAGSSITPAIGADARGVVQVAWTYIVSPRPQILLERFGYISPYGRAMVVSSPTSLPGSPSIGVAPDGSSCVVWPDQATSPQALRYARYTPGLGLGPASTLTPTTGVTQQLGCELMDAAGTLHSVWLVSGPGLNEVHYQRRLAQGDLLPADTTLEVYSGAVQYVRLGADPEGALHLVYQSATSGMSQIRYRRWRPDRGWDDHSTEVTSLNNFGVQRPNVLPESPGNLSVLYTAYPDGSPHFMVRRRTTDLPLPLDVAAVRPIALGLSLGPNPLRAGQSLRVSWAARDPGSRPEVDFFDISGRRVASAPLARTDASAGHAGFGGTLPPAVTARWPSGVYFARVRDSREAAARLVFLR